MKKYTVMFLFFLVFGFSVMSIKVYASTYSPDTVTTSQLQAALNAFKDKVASNPDNYKSVGDDEYWTIHYNGQYLIRFSTVRPSLIPPGVGTNANDTFPALGEWPLFQRGWTADMWVSSSGSYEIPTYSSTGSGNNFNYHETEYFTTYTNYPIHKADIAKTFIRGSVTLGEKYKALTWDGVPDYEHDASAVPTPANLRIKLITPTGLFPKIKETQVQLTWKPTSGALRTEIYMLYNYKKGNDKITKLLPYVSYSDGLFASVGTFTKLMQTDIEAFIHSKNTETDGQTFGNGKLNLTHYYVRYVLQSGEKLKYGNWVKIDIVTGESAYDKGDIVSQYNEVYEDADGNEIEVTDSEYNGIKIDTDGNKVDPTSLRSLTDYLMAIPNILNSLFSSLTSLLGSSGKFGQVFASLFGFLPPEATVLIVTGIGAIVAIGVVKILK